MTSRSPVEALVPTASAQTAPAQTASEQISSIPNDPAQYDVQQGVQLTAEWGRVCDRLRAEVGDVEYRTWLRQMTLAGFDGDEVTIQLPTRFLRDWVRGHYADRLNALWQTENPQVRRVDLRVGMAAPTPPPQVEQVRADVEDRPEPRLADLGGTLENRFSFDAFVVGKPNEVAYACARRVAEQPASPGFNPLFLYGGVGLGKTHLMHAVGLELTRRKQARPPVVLYMSAEKFMYRFIAAIRSKSTVDFKESMRSVDVLMVDDVQFLIGKDSTQEEFFHTFNALVEAGKQIVISSDKSPSELDVEHRLRTRLAGGMVADIHATTFELRISILETKAALAGVDVPRRVLEFLAHKITTNVRELEGALNRLLAHASLFGRAITLESTQDTLRDVLKAHDRRVTIEEIQRRVAEHYHLRLSEMSSARRARAVARPRQVAMFLSKQLTSRSLPEIGRKFGNRDHTTVMHACNRVTELMDTDAGFADDVELLRRMLES